MWHMGYVSHFTANPRWFSLWGFSSTIRRAQNCSNSDWNCPITPKLALPDVDLGDIKHGFVVLSVFLLTDCTDSVTHKHMMRATGQYVSKHQQTAGNDFDKIVRNLQRGKTEQLDHGHHTLLKTGASMALQTDNQ